MLNYRKNGRPGKTSGAWWKSWSGHQQNGRFCRLRWRDQEWSRKGNGGSQEETEKKNCDWLRKLWFEEHTIMSILMDWGENDWNITFCNYMFCNIKLGIYD